MSTTAAFSLSARRPLGSLLNQRLVLGALGAITAGVCLAGGYALHPVWWAPWLAPAFLLAAGRGEPSAARNAGWLAGLIAMSLVLGYYLAMVRAPGTLLLIVLRMAAWGLAASLATRAAGRLPLALASLVLPATLAGLELLTIVISPHGAAGSLAYSQMNMPALVQLASLGGVPAVVFLLLLPGSFAGLLLSRSWSRGQVVGGGAALLALLLAAGGYSAWRLAVAGTGPSRAVAALASSRIQDIPRDWDAVWRLYAPAVWRTARPGMLVVLPEKVALLTEGQAGVAASGVARVAAATGASIVAGVEVQDARGYRNRAFVAEPDGRVSWYDKQRLVPGFEARDRPGRSPLLLRSQGAPLGVAICKDMHIPSIGREYAGRTGLLADPAWDFGRDGWMGARMTALRGVEGGYAIVRSARDGMVGAYDAAGRVVAERRVGAEVAAIQARLTTTAAPTVYGRIGDVFGWLCLVATVGLWLVLRLGPQSTQSRVTVREAANSRAEAAT